MAATGEASMPGVPARLPYSRHSIDQADEAAVLAALRSGTLTGGRFVKDFEQAFALEVGVQHAVAVASGTAALHAMLRAADVGPGDEVIVPALTFLASANSVLYTGAEVVLVDVDPETLLLDPDRVAEAVTDRTKAVLAVDFAGQPCAYDRLERIARPHDVRVLADACHSLGASLRDRPAGSLADASAFSFHPAKAITTGEGGMVATDNEDVARRVRAFRNHGMSRDAAERATAGSWQYDVDRIGWNYRLTDIQAALGLSQLRRLAGAVRRRRDIACAYDQAFRGVPGMRPLAVRPGVRHAYNLYVIEIDTDEVRGGRDAVAAHLRARGIDPGFHYPPIRSHRFHARHERVRTHPTPICEAAARRILSLPLFPSMTQGDVARVVEVTIEAVRTAPP